MEEPSTITDQMREVEGSLMTERDLNGYMKYLEVTIDEITGWGNILEIGSGTEQNFAKEIKEKGYGSKVISIDPRLALPESEDLGGMFPEEHEARLRGRKNPEPNTIAAFAQNLPIASDSVDAILASRSVPLYISSQKDMDSVLSEMCRVLRGGGEIRIYPVAEGVKKLMVENSLRILPKLQILSWERKQEAGSNSNYLLKLRKSH
jgi:SAM-dependent methyltransferase